LDSETENWSLNAIFRITYHELHQNKTKTDKPLKYNWWYHKLTWKLRGFLFFDIME
jgi:hypothetical protein